MAPVLVSAGWYHRVSRSLFSMTPSTPHRRSLTVGERLISTVVWELRR